MSRAIAALLVLAAAALPNFASAADPLPDNVRTQETAGDVLLIGVPLAALAATFLSDAIGSHEADAKSFMDMDTILHMNGRPRHDFMLALGRTVLTTYTLKYSVDEERPNGVDHHSFPSGHTSVTFASAEFVRKEYGWWWGVPAYTLAAFVGYSRVKAQDHYTVDVLSGAAIGILANHDLHEFLTPFGRLNVGPTFTQAHALNATPGMPFREEDVTQFAPTPSIGFELRFK